MRSHASVCVAVSWAVAVGFAHPSENTGRGADAERVARLIQQLGDAKFATRESASRELVDIGEPALAALRQAVASAGDPETRQRAERVIQALAARAAKRELEKLQGTWSLVSYESDGKRIKGEDRGHVFTVNGAQWSIHVGGQVFQAGTVQRVEVKGKLNAIDLLITEGGNRGATAESIFVVEGDSLKYLNCGHPRAAEFATTPGDGRHYLTFRRSRP